jgi:PPOX class probable F420-dependent enzyme
MPNDKLAQFANQNYLNLETFYPDGRGVKTPVWFVEYNGKLYIRTIADSWKVKRVTRNPQVRVVPSQGRGEPLGEWVDGTAVVLEDRAAINQLLKQKYGLQKSAFDLMGRFSGRNYVTLEVTL